MSASITIDGKTVWTVEVPAASMGLPSTQCAWMRERVNDALTAELAKQQQQQQQQGDTSKDAEPKACHDDAGEEMDNEQGESDA